MVVNLSEGLSSALEVVRNISSKDEVSNVQYRNYQMAMSLLILSRRIFDTKSKENELEILKEWHVVDNEIRRFSLAKKDNRKHFLYAGYIGIDNDLGFYIPDNHLDQVLSLSGFEILKYWKRHI